MDSRFNIYWELFSRPQFTNALKASAIIVSLSTITSILVSILAAHVSNFYRFKGKNAIIFSTLIMQMAPGIVLLIPIYIMLSRLGFAGTHTSIILVFTLFVAPMTTWMIRGYFKDIPFELLEAASIDGLSSFKIIYKIVIPIARPGIIAAAIFAFLTCWNELIIPLILSNSETTMLTMYAGTFVNQYDVDYNGLAAVAVYTSFPSILMVLVFNKYLISGLTEGAIKG
ncbi:MAG: carbohydrate ABC transporter permease [Saccharofermentanales bacterium]